MGTTSRTLPARAHGPHRGDTAGCRRAATGRCPIGCGDRRRPSVIRAGESTRRTGITSPCPRPLIRAWRLAAPEPPSSGDQGMAPPSTRGMAGNRAEGRHDVQRPRGAPCRMLTTSLPTEYRPIGHDAGATQGLAAGHGCRTPLPHAGSDGRAHAAGTRPDGHRDGGEPCARRSLPWQVQAARAREHLPAGGRSADVQEPGTNSLNFSAFIPTGRC